MRQPSRSMQKKIDWYKTDDYNTGFEGDGVYTRNPIVKKFIYGILENALSYDEMEDVFPFKGFFIIKKNPVLIPLPIVLWNLKKLNTGMNSVK